MRSFETFGVKDVQLSLFTNKIATNGDGGRLSRNRRYLF